MAPLTNNPGVFHSIEPASNHQNLREIAGHISSRLFFMHIRAAIASAVQQTNCHQFRHDRWLFMHNGYLNEFATIKRDLVFAVDPSLYPHIQGQADTEVLFYLALTFGKPKVGRGRTALRCRPGPGCAGAARGRAANTRSRLIVANSFR